ncbi:hypothetical protein BT96DRAFT_997867 [Gymnopus androsaceus JB14]|uniref:Uncharacterized protein n=1 Tax=Gymnopus androsaceus JB14 TaxID=1447944 RepID=A0A6A4HDP1_9AGAR|nr:hypothetical protein BT96DRAFT_997867 [Gymnopus androsaceus JB14]
MQQPSFFRYQQQITNCDEYARIVKRRKESGGTQIQFLAAQAFAASIRSLYLDQSDRPSEEDVKITGELLHHLTNLSQIRFHSDMAFLRLINCHTVPTAVLDREHPAFSILIGSDILLEKILLDEGQVYNASPGGVIWNPNFHGLRELKLDLHMHPTLSLSWLSEFTRRHPLLKKTIFKNASSTFVPFIDSFIKKAESEGLAVLSAPEPFSEWYISGLHLCISEWSSGKLLHLAHSLFPKISTLTIEIEFESECSISYDELVPLLCRFPSLQVVTFIYALSLVDFGDQPSYQELEDALIQYTSRIARQVPTIEAFYVDDVWQPAFGEYWPIMGWLNVQTSHEGRHTVGPLCHEVKYSGVTFYV